MQDGLTEIQGRLEVKQQEARNRLDALERFKSQFRDNLLNTPRDHDNPAVDEIMLVTNGHFNPAKYKRELHYCHDHAFDSKMFSSRNLQRIITEQKAALVKQMKDDIRAITTDDFSLSLHRNGERRNNIRKFVHEAFRDFALRMLKDDGIKFEPCFPAEEAEAMIRTVVERLELPDLQSSFFVNVDEVTGKATISVKKIDCWKNLLWEFRKRDTGEAQQVFADYFNPTTETGPFAEMIEAVAEKIREGIAAWMNEIAFNALKESFIKAMDLELEKCLRIESDHMSLNELDNDAIESMIEKCQDLNNKMKML